MVLQSHSLHQLLNVDRISDRDWGVWSINTNDRSTSFMTNYHLIGVTGIIEFRTTDDQTVSLAYRKAAAHAHKNTIYIIQAPILTPMASGLMPKVLAASSFKPFTSISSGTLTILFTFSLRISNKRRVAMAAAFFTSSLTPARSTKQFAHAHASTFRCGQANPLGHAMIVVRTRCPSLSVRFVVSLPHHLLVGCIDMTTLNMHLRLISESHVVLMVAKQLTRRCLHGSLTCIAIIKVGACWYPKKVKGLTFDYVVQVC